MLFLLLVHLLLAVLLHLKFPDQFESRLPRSDTLLPPRILRILVVPLVPLFRLLRHRLPEEVGHHLKLHQDSPHLQHSLPLLHILLQSGILRRFPHTPHPQRLRLARGPDPLLLLVSLLVLSL